MIVPILSHFSCGAGQADEQSCGNLTLTADYICLVKNRASTQWEEIWWAAEQIEPLPEWTVEEERV